MTTLCSGDIGYVNALAFAPDSRTLALSANGVTVWDLVTGQCLKKLDTDYIYDTNQMLHVVGLAFSVRGDLLALLDQGDQLKLWNWKTSSNEGSDDYSTKPIRLARVMSDGRLVIAASDAHIDLWNAETGRHLVALGGHKDQASVLKLPYNNRALALTSKDGCMRHWNLALGDCFGVLNIGGSHYYSAVTLSCDGKLVAFPLDDEAVEIWETTGNRTVRIEAACSSWISRLAFSRDGSMLASGAKDINIWETQTGQNICSIGGQNGLVRDMIFSVDGNFLASCADSDNTVRIWNTSTGKCIRVLSHENSICAIAISRDSRILASIHGRSIIYIWDLEHNRLLDRMKRPGLALSEDHFWFSDDGRFLCSDFGCVRLDLRDMNDSEGKGEWSIGKSRCHSHSISVRDDWVMKGDKRIIWIPPEYRDRQPVIVRDRTIVLRPSGGVLTILRLRPDMHFG
ncbi:quinon protein alcohol dehydrogenase-like superfamily [Aspergillus pseudoustus]|uniref:Quinon protein alcohol dehydrogenase-like superfamily n=1 Tax=Aspergillus pseudoustus TaxID=1810923 RepID=A0ABR4JC69_9EURO